VTAFVDDDLTDSVGCEWSEVWREYIGAYSRFGGGVGVSGELKVVVVDWSVGLGVAEGMDAEASTTRTEMEIAV